MANNRSDSSLSGQNSIAQNSAATGSTKINTTVGELIEALTQVAIEAGNTEQEGYRLASLALADLMKQRRAQLRKGATTLDVH